jgi:hypothetical protein
MTVTEASGRRTTWRLLPSVASDGFLLYPFIESSDDMKAFFDGRALKGISTLQIDSPKGREFWRDAEVRLYRLRALKVDDVNAYQELVSHGISTIAPEKVLAPTPLEYFTIELDTAVLAHAPSTMTFTVPDGTHKLTFGFGIRPGAYQNEEHTDGVEFCVTVRDADGHDTILWQRLLRPTEIASDRGTQKVDLPLPPNIITLHLETKSGPNSDARWDWSYWTGIRIDELEQHDQRDN